MTKFKIERDVRSGDIRFSGTLSASDLKSVSPLPADLLSFDNAGDSASGHLLALHAAFRLIEEFDRGRDDEN